MKHVKLWLSCPLSVRGCQLMTMALGDIHGVKLASLEFNPLTQTVDLDCEERVTDTELVETIEGTNHRAIVIPS